MEDNPLTIQEQEHYAIDNYVKQRSKMSGKFRKQINKTLNKETLIGGTLGGLAMGVVIGAMYGQINAQVPEYDASGHVIEYKYDGKKMSESMLSVIAGALLVTLAASGIKILAESKRNYALAEKLAFNTFRKSFKPALQAYRPQDQQHVPPVNKARATALVLTNMPSSELTRLQELAESALIRDDNGNFRINEETIATASQIISNFIDYNPEVGYNVLRIMRGDEPVTYFLPSFHKQKTR